MAGPRTVAALLTAAALAGAALLLHGAPLHNPTAPSGELSFELARTAQDAWAILGSWERDGVTGLARTQLLWGLGFAALYATALALLYRRLSPLVAGFAPALARWGRRLALAQWAAAAADLVENALLLTQLGRGASGWAAGGAWLASLLQIALVGLGPLWLVLAAIALQRSGRPIFQLLYACRFPLLAAVALAALGPVAAGPAEELLQNLFALLPREVFWVTLLACLCAWTALLALETVLAYAALRLPAVERPPVRLTEWLRRRRTLVTVYLVAPAWLTAVWISANGFDLGARGIALWLAGSAGGVAGAVALYAAAGWLQARTAPAPVAAAGADPGRPAAPADGRPGPDAESELLLLRRRAPEIAAGAGPLIAADADGPAREPGEKPPRDRRDRSRSPDRFSGRLRRLVRRFEHLLVRGLFAHLGPGYVRRGEDDRMDLLEGHRRSLWFFAVTAAIYLAGWWALDPRRLGPSFPPLGFVLILLLGAAWVLPGLSYFLDRYRVPVSAAVVIYAFLAATLLSGLRELDHRFETVPGGGDAAGPLELLDAAERADPSERPLVVIAASGGGIRASRWTARALTALEDAAPHAGVGPELSEAIRFLSAVSGGSAGTYFWLAHRVPDPDREPGDEAERVLAAAGASCLHGSTWGLAYPDLWRVVPPPVVGWTGMGLGRDRGWGLEECWRRVDRLRDDLDRLGTWAGYAAAGELPAFALNTTVVETGEPFLFAPFAVPADWGAVGFADQLPGSDVRVTTAARLSATFPWVTPVARADDGAIDRLPELRLPDRRYRFGHHLADGGYYDNTGAVTALAWIDTVLRERPALRQRGVILILLGAYPEPGAADDLAGEPVLRRTRAPSGGLVTEVSGPLTALLAVRSSSQSNRNQREIDDLRLKWWHAAGARIEPFRFDFDGDAPLSWKLTEEEAEEIDAGWTTEAVQTEVARLRTCFTELAGDACVTGDEWTPLPPRGTPAPAPPPAALGLGTAAPAPPATPAADEPAPAGEPG